MSTVFLSALTLLVCTPPSTAFVSSVPTASAIKPAAALFSSIQARPSIVSSATVQSRMNRCRAQRVITDVLCPPEEERDRNKAGMQAFHSSADRGTAIENDDPRTHYTYGEFPLDSFDLLVDRALEYTERNGGKDGWSGEQERRKNVMVDLGSGCGRLVFYAALTRGNEGEEQQRLLSGDGSGMWDFHGVEIGSQLHSLAVNSLQRGVDNGWFLFPSDDGDDEDDVVRHSSSKIEFHNGNALLVDDPYFPSHSLTDGRHDNSATAHNPIQSLLSQTRLLFAYSTVWETDSSQPFDPDLQAMILSPKWSQTLASLCPNGCIAVTTDRALNPRDGWRLLENMAVDNPSVWGSVGYISVLEK